MQIGREKVGSYKTPVQLQGGLQQRGRITYCNQLHSITELSPIRTSDKVSYRTFCWGGGTFWNKLTILTHAKQVVCKAHPSRGVWGHAPPENF